MCSLYPQATEVIMNNIPRNRDGQTSTNPAKLYKNEDFNVNKITPQYSQYFALSGKSRHPGFGPLSPLFLLLIELTFIADLMLNGYVGSKANGLPSIDFFVGPNA